jgi:ribonuclease Z
MIKSASEIMLGSLILGHFSSRYSDEQIDSSILVCCEKYGLNIPVYRILPGQGVKNILNTDPIYMK